MAASAHKSGAMGTAPLGQTGAAGGRTVTGSDGLLLRSDGLRLRSQGPPRRGCGCGAGLRLVGGAVWLAIGVIYLAVLTRGFKRTVRSFDDPEADAQMSEPEAAAE